MRYPQRLWVKAIRPEKGGECRRNVGGWSVEPRGAIPESGSYAGCDSMQATTRNGTPVGSSENGNRPRKRGLALPRGPPNMRRHRVVIGDTPQYFGLALVHRRESSGGVGPRPSVNR